MKESLQRKLWLWGQESGSHHVIYPGMPGVNRMTSAEACRKLGLVNCCRVVMNNLPAPADFDREAAALRDREQLVWSITGSWGSVRNDDGRGDLDAVIELARRYPNITGGVLDDFLTEKRRNVFTPEKLESFKAEIVRSLGRKLDLWVVVYDFELELPIREHLQACDVITYWSWYPDRIGDFEQNFARLRAMVPDKRLLLGIYLWDYAADKERKVEEFAAEMRRNEKMLDEGLIDGIILCSNCNFDIGLETYDWLEDFLRGGVEKEAREV